MAEVSSIMKLKPGDVKTEHLADNAVTSQKIADNTIVDADVNSLSRAKISDFWGSPFWQNIPDKPATYPPDAHSHSRSEITDFAHTHVKSEITDFAHTHTKSEITDFAHTHPVADLTDHTKSVHDALGIDAATLNGESAVNIAWKKIAEIDVTSDTTQVTISGLDINTHKVYEILFKVKNPQATDAALYIYFNGDTNNANYYRQLGWFAGTSAAASRASDSTFLSLPAGNSAIGRILVQIAPDGLAHYLSHTTSYLPSYARVETYAGAKKSAAVTNITQIDIIASVAGAIGAGSKIILFGRLG